MKRNWDEIQFGLVDDVWHKIIKYLPPEEAIFFALTCKTQRARVRTLIKQSGLKFMFFKRCTPCGSENSILHQCPRVRGNMMHNCPLAKASSNPKLPIVKIKNFHFVVKCEEVKTIKWFDEKFFVTLTQNVHPSWGSGFTGTTDEFYYFWHSNMQRDDVWWAQLYFRWTTLTGLTTIEQPTGICRFRLIWGDDSTLDVR